MIIDGKGLAKRIAEELKNTILAVAQGENAKHLTLAILQVGDLPQSNLYIKQKKRVGAEIGIEVRHIILDADSSYEEVSETINTLNDDNSVTAMILQLPLPEHLKSHTPDLTNRIDPQKDADGLTAHNIECLEESQPEILPATPRGIISLLEKNNIEIKGKKAVVVGRSTLVGKPVALLLKVKGAYVTIVHSQTENPKQIIQKADIVVIAIGKAKYFDASYFRKGQTVIDVGINEYVDTIVNETGESVQVKKLCGDVDFDEVSKVVDAITPVPGGVGPMTVVSLFENVVKIGLK